MPRLLAPKVDAINVAMREPKRTLVDVIPILAGGIFQRNFPREPLAAGTTSGQTIGLAPDRVMYSATRSAVELDGCALLVLLDLPLAADQWPAQAKISRTVSVSRPQWDAIRGLLATWQPAGVGARRGCRL